MTIRIKGLDHIVLRTENAAAMVRFYCEVLGCVEERRRVDLGLTQLRAGDSLIDLVTLDGPLGKAGGAAPGPNGRNLDHFCLQLEAFDAEAIATQLFAHGLETDESVLRYGAGGYGPSIYVRDPDGNTVELKGPPENDERP